jgi:hypothetical protein
VPGKSLERSSIFNSFRSPTHFSCKIINEKLITYKLGK